MCHSERQRRISDAIFETLTALARGASVAVTQGEILKGNL